MVFRLRFHILAIQHSRFLFLIKVIGSKKLATQLQAGQHNKYFRSTHVSSGSVGTFALKGSTRKGWHVKINRVEMCFVVAMVRWSDFCLGGFTILQNSQNSLDQHSFVARCLHTLFLCISFKRFCSRVARLGLVSEGCRPRGLGLASPQTLSSWQLQVRRRKQFHRLTGPFPSHDD